MAFSRRTFLQLAALTAITGCSAQKEIGGLITKTMTGCGCDRWQKIREAYKEGKNNTYHLQIGGEEITAQFLDQNHVIYTTRKLNLPENLETALVPELPSRITLPQIKEIVKTEIAYPISFSHKKQRLYGAKLIGDLDEETRKLSDKVLDAIVLQQRPLEKYQ